MRVVCLVGPRGCGKTTLVRSVLPRLRGFEYIDAKAVLRSVVGLQYHRFEEFPDDVKEGARVEVVRRIRRDADRLATDLLVEDHATAYNSSSRSYEASLPYEASHLYTEIVLLSIGPRLLLERRRMGWEARQRCDIGSIRRELGAEEAEARRFAERHGIPLHVLHDEGGLEAGVRLFRVLSNDPGATLDQSQPHL